MGPSTPVAAQAQVAQVHVRAADFAEFDLEQSGVWFKLRQRHFRGLRSPCVAQA